MRKLLNSLGDVWNTLPKEIAFLTIQKGTGTHTMVTIDRGTLNFHSVPFRSELPAKQEIILDGLTTAELISTINGMGYVVSLTSEAIEKGLDVHKPFVMIEVENVPLDATLNAFTSKLWKRLYPIYRTLRQAEMDIDLALKMLYVDMASGDWLDFWADFFSIKREPGESDNDFIRRFLTWLFNPKANNIALKELLAYRLKDNNIDVKDKAPSEFEVLVSTKYLHDSVALHKILSEAKAAGVEYFLRYIEDPFFDDYRLYISDAMGIPFDQSDHLVGKQLQKGAEDTFGSPQEAYLSSIIGRIFDENPYIGVNDPSNFGSCFTLMKSDLNSAELLQVNGAPTPLSYDVAIINVVIAGNTVKQVIV
jgi:hypothetical protein